MSTKKKTNIVKKDASTTNVEVKTKRPRKTFEEAKAAKLAMIDEKIAATEKHLQDLKDQRAAVEARQPKMRTGRMSEKTKQAKLVELAKSQGVDLAQLLSEKGIEIPDGLK